MLPNTSSSSATKCSYGACFASRNKESCRNKTWKGESATDLWKVFEIFVHRQTVLYRQLFVN